MRSKEGINLASLAEKFGGGGHISAAGCTIQKKLALKRQIILSAQDLLIKHNASKCLLHSSSSAETSQDIHKPGISFSIPEIVFCQTVTAQKIKPDNWPQEDESSFFTEALERKCAS
ncbi:MAG: hypothetical protein GX640_17740, partial [Fibrobacter sp.]|nr:hypothetical protein [Fibrobacter sp.]